MLILMHYKNIPMIYLLEADRLDIRIKLEFQKIKERCLKNY